MTDILLAIIVAIMVARVILQLRQVSKAVGSGYTTTSEVENIETVEEKADVACAIEEYGCKGYELVQVLPIKDGMVWLFFTRKKIKTYYK